MDLWKKLKFWRRRDVKADIQARERDAQLDVQSTMGRWKKLKFWKRRDLKIEMMARERDAALVRLEAFFRDRETDLVKKLEVQRQVEATLRGRVCDLENKLKEQKQVEATLRAHISEVEEKRELRRQCEKLRVSLTKAHFQKETANIRITDLENKVQEKDLERKNVEAYQNCVINELCVRLRRSNRNRTEEAAAFQGRMKKLNKKLQDTNNEKKEEEPNEKKEEEPNEKKEEEPNEKKEGEPNEKEEEEPDEKKEEEPAPRGKMKLVAVAVTMVVAVVCSYINYGVNLG